MKHPVILLFAASVLYAQCPLGFTPEEACSADDPSCGLFSDGNGDSFCDNARPQEQPVEEEIASDPFCPLNLSPSQACSQENAGCTFYTDSSEDGFCDNPGPRPAPPVEETVQVEDEQPEPPIETIEVGAEEETEDTLEALSVDSLPGLAVEEAEETVEPGYTCPLNLSVEEACREASPLCALYMDLNEDGRCDNPGTVCVPEDSTCGLQTPSIVGCPLGLPPEGACPDSLALCPHWFGVTHHTTCSNPAGGNRRINIILITLVVLLPVSTWLSRRFYGRRLKDRLRRNSAHHIIRGVSLMILGFVVQGCFCPLGTFQYAFTSEGLTFLGLSGLLIFLLPLVFSAFFGRIYCGWVCPMGAVQEFLYSIHVPGRFSPSGRHHNKLKYLSTFILFALIAAILLNRFNIISLKWPAPFCAIDPFHTIFTLFLSGSMIIAGVTIILAIFIRRFFCRYLCFYGAALALFAKLTLWNRIQGIREKEPEMHSDEEFDK